MPPRPLALAASLAALAGCFRETTDVVKVHDPHQVRVAREDGTVVLPPGTDPAVATLKEGTHFVGFWQRRPYRVVLTRDGSGQLSLRCEGCEGGRYPPSSPTLLDASGALSPVDSGSLFPTRGPLVLTPEGVDLEISPCLLPRSKGCSASATARLFTPWPNVVDIHRTRRTSTVGGLLLTGWGATLLAFGVALAAMPGESKAVRAGSSAPTLAVGATALAGGIWHLTAPVIEERPDVARPAAPY
jgi:hypothetical protein